MKGPSRWVVPGIAAAQIRHRPLRWLLVSSGVALAVSLLVGTQGMAALVADRALRQGLETLPVGDRSVAVTYNEFLDDPAERAALDAAVRQRLAGITAGSTASQVVFRELADPQGGVFLLGASDDLADRVSLRSGRLPKRCGASVCEVVMVGDEPAPSGLGALRLEVVGRVSRLDPLLLSGRFESATGAPLLLADGVGSASAITALERFQRVYSWVAPVDVDRIRELGVDGYLDRSSEVQTELYRVQRGLILAAPDSVLRAEADRAARSSTRFALLGGSAAALLLGFALLGALGLRRDQADLLSLLRRRGADGRQRRSLVCLESLVVVAAGAVGGLVLGGVAVAVLAAGDGLDARSSAWGAAVAAFPASVLLVLVAGVLVAGTLLWPATDVRHGWRALDLALGGTLLLVVAVVSRGGVSVSSLDARVDPLLVMLPLLVALAVGLVAARVWPLVARGLQAVLPRRALSARLALLGGLRAPVRVAATAAFFAAAVCSVAFAGSYRSTLEAGAADRAVFETGLDARVSVAASLESPLAVASLADYEGLAPGAFATPVVRSAVSARKGTLDAAAVQLIGVDPSALPAVPRWDRVVGGGDPKVLEGLLRADPPRSGALVPGAGALTVDARGPLRDYGVTLWFRAADGRAVGVPLALEDFVPSGSGRSGSGVLTGAVPDLGGPVTLYRAVIRQPTDDASRRQHALGERATDVPLIGGTIVLGAPVVGGRPVTEPWLGWGSPGATVRAGGDSLAVVFKETGDAVVAGPGLGESPPLLPVAVDPTTAGLADPNGVVALDPGSEEPLLVRVVATLPRFPTAPSRFVVADAAALGGLLDARNPGEGSAREVWVAAPDGGASLEGPLAAAPYSRLSVSHRAQREETLAADPVAGGAATVLVLAALVALLMAVVALVLLVVSDRRDDAGELYAWEVDGVPPSALRQLLAARAASVLLVAVPLGLAGGLLLAGATARLVGVTATGGAAQPPPQLAVDGGWLLVSVLVAVTVAFAVAAAVAALALREPLPDRARA